MLPSTQTQSSQPPALQFVPSDKIQSLTVVSLGKMCLQNEEQAKKIIPAFGQILDNSNDPAMKNNIMYALTDMCVRFASLVDPLLPQMTACLKDKYLSVRRTTLILLIHLLQEDYLKIRGNGKFFFRLMQTLLDPSDEIKHLTTFYIQQRMLKRLPKIMYSNFAESIFHFNDFKEHSSFNKFVVSDKEKVLFDLSGDRRIENRRFLYKFMLENMNDEQRFQTTYRLCQDVLGGVVEDNIKITPASVPLLKDTFFILASDAIKLASLKSKASDDDTENEQGMVLEAAKKQIITGVVKKNVIENIIPIIIALKHKLENAKSPLISDLFNYLRKLMDDYKNEVTEILAADKQLAKEIEFDLRRFEQEELERKEREEQEALRPVRSRTNSPAAARLSPVPSAASSRRASLCRTPSGTPGGGASSTRKQRRNLVRQALENAAAASAPNLNNDKSAHNTDIELTVVNSNNDSVKNKTTSAPSALVTTTNDNNGTVIKSPQAGDGRNDNDEDSTLKANENKDAAKTKNAKTLIHRALPDQTEKETNKEVSFNAPLTAQNQSQDERTSNLESSKNPEEAETEGIVNKENIDKAAEANKEVEADTEKDHDKSKRVSGQGMPRPRTPKSKKFHNVRAISTPQVTIIQ